MSTLEHNVQEKSYWLVIRKNWNITMRMLNVIFMRKHLVLPRLTVVFSFAIMKKKRPLFYPFELGNLVKSI